MENTFAEQTVVWVTNPNETEEEEKDANLESEYLIPHCLSRSFGQFSAPIGDTSPKRERPELLSASIQDWFDRRPDLVEPVPARVEVGETGPQTTPHRRSEPESHVAPDLKGDGTNPTESDKKTLLSVVYPIFTFRWLAVHILGVPTVFFLGAISSMQFLQR